MKPIYCIITFTFIVMLVGCKETNNEASANTNDDLKVDANLVQNKSGYIGDCTGEVPVTTGNFDELQGEKCWKLFQEEKYGAYTVRIYDRPNHLGYRVSYLEIFKDNIPVEHVDNLVEPVIGSYDDLKIGCDITGNGIPNLLITSTTDGNCQHLKFILYELGDKFRLIQKLEKPAAPEIVEIEPQTVYSPSFRDVDGEPGLEFIDYCSVYRESFGQRTMEYEFYIPVIFKYRNGKYRFSNELMKREPLTHEKIYEMAESLKDKKLWYNSEFNVPEKVIRTMLELALSGNLYQSIELLNMAWPKNLPDKDKFRNSYLIFLQDNRFWNDIKRLTKENRSGKSR